ncbi:hypothetical protein [Deinococcus hopiensis]|uniref:Uncharacterized protein n=1 Tax=Deinococcus hopiensis KR-140 TaxID=695939 RepID=A0A1W1UK40_9DEIO|nr:hypothetical protein [Deinococcus hopiensis]SMB81383.1 hypothetical protein SAMN00790413_04559 [Deinococcus hopiensis KR-140]
MTLAQAVEELYQAFADLPRPQHIVHEPYELHPHEIQQLLGCPLRELPPELMRSYLFDALFTVGTWDDFRYFLPRLLELVPAEEIEEEKVAYRLKYAQEQGFLLSGGQQAALHAYALAYWDEVIPRWPWYASMLLDGCTLEAFGVQRAELLDRWWVHPKGALALAQDLHLNGQLPPEWSTAQVTAWVQAAFLAAPNDEEAQLLSGVLLMLKHSPRQPDD